jgi:hypothetical protein
MSELQASTVLRKTEAGIDGIKQRDPRLSPKLRMSLILVDGTKSVAELLKSLPNPEEAMQVLTQLLDAGFVSIVAAPQAAPKPAPAPAQSAKDHEPDAADLKAAVRRATHLLDAMLGPDAEVLCLQIERCTSSAQLNGKIIEISRIIAAMRSEKKAAEFLLAATS